MKEPFLPITSSNILNTRAGFKLIYETMQLTNDFSKAMKLIFRDRYLNITAIEAVLKDIKDRYVTEKHDYIHALYINQFYV